jgi:hypothetical protein
MKHHFSIKDFLACACGTVFKHFLQMWVSQMVGQSRLTRAANWPCWHAGVLVLPSTVQGDPVAAFEELFARPGALPPLMQQGVMEPRIPKHYVLLHDASTAPPGTLERCGVLR